MFYMEAKNLLGTPKCKLNDISQPYTSDHLKHRVINDVCKQEGGDILGIKKLIFNYLEITTDQVVGLFTEDGINSQVLAFADPLVKQAISWTILTLSSMGGSSGPATFFACNC